MGTRTADHRDLLDTIDRLAPLGWGWKDTTSGVVIQAPPGRGTPDNPAGTVCMHRSGSSDHRGMLNMLKVLNRLGLEQDLDTLQTERVRNRRVRLAADRAATDVTVPVEATEAAAAWFSASGDDTPRPSGIRGMTSRTERITPERARQLYQREFTAELADGTRLRQRKVNEEHVKWLTQIILDGEWKTLPGGISFAPDGSCLDGQHRLRAIHAAGMPPDGQPVEVRVHYNVPPEYFAAIDTGKVRSAADALHIENLSAGSTLMAASTLKLLICYRAWLDHPDTIPPWASWGSWRITNDKIVAAVRDYPHLGEHIRYAHNMSKASNLVTASLAAFRQIALAAWPEGATKLDEYCVDLRPDRAERVLEAGNPAMTLRRYVGRVPKGNIRPRREVLLVLLLKHWNAYAQDKVIKQVTWDSSDPMPMPYTPATRRRARRVA